MLHATPLACGCRKPTCCLQLGPPTCSLRLEVSTRFFGLESAERLGYTTAPFTTAPRPFQCEKTELLVEKRFTASAPIGTTFGWAALVLAFCVATLSGCVQRRLVIRSNPPGALVYIDDYQIGTTPIATNFTYYGTRKIRLVKDGYETLTVMQTIPPPWYQIPPLDFITENLVPGELRDHRTFEYQLMPQAVVPTEQLLSRAESLRAQTQTSGVVRSELGQAPGPPAVPLSTGQPLPGPGSPAAVLPPGPAPVGGTGFLGVPGGDIPRPLEPPGAWQGR